MNKIQQTDQNGFGHIGIVLILLVVAVVGFAGYRVMNNKKDVNVAKNTTQTTDKTTQEQLPDWPVNDKITWTATGQGSWISLPYDMKPPSCPSPLKLALPTPDITQATSLLYPGQTRLGSFEGKGGNYKPHGGLRFDNSKDNAIDVVMPFNGSVFRGSRHLVDGEIQYSFDIVNACGVMIRLGHLRDLTPAFQAIANKFPAAIEGDSRTSKVEPNSAFKTGDKIATAVGFRTAKNVGFDFGVYDLRSDNQASKDPSYKAAHADTAELSFHALCWLELLNPADTTVVKALPAADKTAGSKSDYCK